MSSFRSLAWPLHCLSGTIAAVPVPHNTTSAVFMRWPPDGYRGVGAGR